MRICSVSMDMGNLRCSLCLFSQPLGWWGGHVILDGPTVQPALSLMSFMIIILGLRLCLALVLLCRFNVVERTCCEGQGVGGSAFRGPGLIFLRKFAHILKVVKL